MYDESDQYSEDEYDDNYCNVNMESWDYFEDQYDEDSTRHSKLESENQHLKSQIETLKHRLASLGQNHKFEISELHKSHSDHVNEIHSGFEEVLEKVKIQMQKERINSDKREISYIDRIINIKNDLNKLKRNHQNLIIQFKNKSTILEQYITLSDEFQAKYLDKHQQLKHYIQKHKKQKAQIENFMDTQNHLQEKIEQLTHTSADNELEHISVVNHLTETINTYRDQQKQNNTQIKQLKEQIKHKRVEYESQLCHCASLSTTTTNQNAIHLTKEHSDDANFTSRTAHIELSTNSSHNIMHNVDIKKSECITTVDNHNTIDITTELMTAKQPISEPATDKAHDIFTHQKTKTVDIATHGQLAMGNTNTNHTSSYSHLTHIDHSDDLSHLYNIEDSYIDVTKRKSKKYKKKKKYTMVNQLNDTINNHIAQQKQHKSQIKLLTKQINQLESKSQLCHNSTCNTAFTGQYTHDFTPDHKSTANDVSNEMYSANSITMHHEQANNIDKPLAKDDIIATHGQLAMGNVDTSHTSSNSHLTHNNQIIVPYNMLSLGTFSINHKVNGHPSANTDNTIATYDQLAISNSRNDNISESTKKHMENSMHNDAIITHVPCIPSPQPRTRQLSNDLKWDTTFDFSQLQGLSSTFTSPIRLRHNSLGIYEDIFHKSTMNSQSHMFKTPDKLEHESSTTSHDSPDDSSEIEISLSPLNLNQGKVRYRSKSSITPNLNKTHHSMFKNYCTLVPVKIQADDDHIMNRTCWM